jgi:TonB-dependent receptor
MQILGMIQSGRPADSASKPWGEAKMISVSNACARANSFKAFCLGSSAIALFAGSATPALAQTSVEAEQEEAQQEVQEEGEGNQIVVSGIRASLANAVNDKRLANSITDGISAEGLANFPDLDLAEALQRVTGIQINRQNRARTGSVLIRGLPETFSLTTFNGQTLQPPQFDNNEAQGVGFPLGILRSEVVGGVTVIKSLTAEHNIGGLSGIIDIRTRRPLESKDGLVLSLDGRYEPFADSLSPGGALALTKEIIPGTLGITLAAGFQALDYRRDQVSVNIWGTAPGNAELVPLEIRQSHSGFEGEQFSFSGELQWAPNEELDFAISGIFGQQNLENTEEFFRLNQRPFTVITPLSAPAVDGSLRSVRMVDPRINIDSRVFDETWRSWALSGRGKWTSDRAAIDFGVNYTEGFQDFPMAAFVFNTNQNVRNGGVFDIFTGNGNYKDFGIVAVTPPGGGTFQDYFAGAVANGFGTAAPAAFPLNAPSIALPSFQLSTLGRTQQQNSSELSYDVNGELFFEELPLIDSIKFGLKVREIQASQDSATPTLFGLNLRALDASILRPPLFAGGDAFFGGDVTGFADGWVSIDVERALELAGPPNTTNLPNNTFFVNQFGMVNGNRPGRQFTNIYDVNRDITAFYGMANFSGDIGPVRFSGNVGARYVNIDRTALGFEILNGQPERPIETRNAFSKVLPSGNVAFELTEKLVFRAAASQSVVPPNPIDFASNTIVDTNVLSEPNPGLIEDPTIQVALGNSSLDPFTAVNVDFALEWYNRPGSLVALTLFQKTVAAEPTTVEACPLDGGTLGLGALQVITSGPQVGCFLATTPAGFTEPVRVNIRQTDVLSYKLQGVEFSVVQNLDFLPGFLKNLGAQFNYTYVDVVNGLEELPQISRHTVNAILFYETEKFAVRGAYNYRSSFFLESNSTIFGLEDRIVQSRGQFDASIAYNFNDHFTLQAEAFNLTNEPLVQTEGELARLRSAENYGRAFTLSARYKF